MKINRTKQKGVNFLIDAGNVEANFFICTHKYSSLEQKKKKRARTPVYT